MKTDRERIAILHVITGLSAGGAERALYQLLAAGLAERFENEVVSLSDEGGLGGAIRGLGVPVHCLGMRRGVPSAGAVYRLRKLAEGFRPSVIQGWMYHGNLAAWTARRRVGEMPALVWNVRQSLYGLQNEKPMTRLVIRANRLLSGAPAAIVYNSRLSRRQHEAFGFDSGCGDVIPNGFDLERGAAVAHSRNLRAELVISGDARVVGHVARLHPTKNHAGFLRAAAGVAARLPDVHVVLIGRDVVAGNRNLLTCLPDGVRARFHFLGERRDAADLMGALDVLCVSSWGEAFPNVLGEAMAAGVPCVATDVGDSADIVGDTGLIVPPGDEAALAAALEDVLSRPQEERRRLGEAARARVQAYYSLAAAVDRYGRLYEGLARGNGGARS